MTISAMAFVVMWDSGTVSYHRTKKDRDRFVAAQQMCTIWGEHSELGQPIDFDQANITPEIESSFNFLNSFSTPKPLH